MADRALHGNGEPCPACALRREAVAEDGNGRRPLAVPCNACGGTGRVPIPDAEIIARTCDEARRLYWPMIEARWAATMTKVPP